MYLPEFESYVILNTTKTKPLEDATHIVFESYVILNTTKTATEEFNKAISFESYVILNTTKTCLYNKNLRQDV